MLDGILNYIRSWFPASDPYEYEINRKRRASEASPRFSSPKYRKVLCNMSNNLEDDFFASPMRRATRNSPSILIDDDDSACLGSRTKEIKTAKDSKPPCNRSKFNGNDDLSFVSDVKSTTEKKWDAKKAGFSYITRFTPVTTKSPANSSADISARSKISPILKSRDTKVRPSLSRTFLSSPSLNYSIRLDEKKKYNQLLENIALNGSFNNSSLYGTPIGDLYAYNTCGRSRKLVELAREKNRRSFDVVDLTSDSKPKLSTKDRVIKVLDDFENDVAVIEDSDSDVEILPTPPSPKPDIKVERVNSLKTVVDTSRHTKQQWLDDITKKHESFLEGKTKEIRAYAENSSSLNEINRDLLIQNLSRKVQDSLAIKEAILPVIEVEEETELPELTSEHLKIIKRAFSGNSNEVLTKKFNLNLNRKDIETLAGLNWLNDNVINFYMNLIIERGEKSDRWPKTYCMNTFFYQKLSSSGPESLRRWTRKIDLFSYEFVCVPIHLGVHWCMAIINLKEKTIKYFDSMGKPNNYCLNALREYLEYEHKDKKGQEYSTKGFILENVQDIPQQMNGSDCGMFSCTFAEFATRKAKFSFSQEDMPYLRKKMVVEIITGQLLIQ